MQQDDGARPDALEHVPRDPLGGRRDIRVRIGLYIPHHRRPARTTEIPREPEQLVAERRTNEDVAHVARGANQRIGALDLRSDEARRPQYHPLVRVRVIPQLVTGGNEPLSALWQLRELATRDEERRANPAALEHTQHAVDDRGSRPIIERERNATLGRIDPVDEPARHLERARTRKLPQPGEANEQDE